jgi:hypothetical protein
LEINHCSGFPSKVSRRIAAIADTSSVPNRCFSATLELEINRSRGRGLRNRGIYGLSRSEIEFCEEQ